MSRRPAYYNAIPERAFVIEVIDALGTRWHAMATERGGITRELSSAPPAASITIFEWWLTTPPPVSAQDTTFGNRPVWRLVEQYPWTLEERK